MKLLVFEYSSVCLDNSLVSEGWNMLKCLLSDLEHISFLDTYFLIDKKLDSFSFKNCHSIYLDCNLTDWLNTHVDEFDYCLFIAPEDNLIQYNITKLLESKEIFTLVSDSYASFICSSKYLTYLNTPDDILKIKTMKVDLNNINYKKIEHFFDDYDFIVKPDNRTSSNLIYHVFNKEAFEDVLIKYKDNNITDILIQEYISGEAVSVSVICNEKFVNCISINSQVINIEDNCIEYFGCDTPIEHIHKKELYSISKEIIESIPGLNGFVGIDYIICDDKIYFVEVNARFTTPFIVLQEKCTENLTEQIFKTIVEKKRNEITFKDKGRFSKKRII